MLRVHKRDGSDSDCGRKLQSNQQMENRAIARLLSETADLMEIAGEDSFRIRSYRNAAGVIEGHPEADLRHSQRPRAQSHRYSGHRQRHRGRARRRSNSAAASNGAMRCSKNIRATALELLKIQGLGPKSIRAAVRAPTTSPSIDDLERLCREQKLRELPRMGAKLEEKVLRSIAAYRQRAGPLPAELRAATSPTN